MVPGVGTAISDETYQEAISEAGQKAGFDPDEASALAAIQRTKAPVLLMHGTDDKIVPAWHGVRLHEAARDHSRLVLIPGMGHTTIWCDKKGEVANRACAWFDRYLAGRETVAR
jgi:pimeloyl-ACP methyl ester carboxylesterase